MLIPQTNSTPIDLVSSEVNGCSRFIGIAIAIAILGPAILLGLCLTVLGVGLLEPFTTASGAALLSGTSYLLIKLTCK